MTANMDPFEGADRKVDRQADPLDAILRRATWPIPDADRVDELRAVWAEMNRRRRTRRRDGALAVAAALLLSLTAGLWYHGRARRSDSTARLAGTSASDHGQPARSARGPARGRGTTAGGTLAARTPATEARAAATGRLSPRELYERAVTIAADRRLTRHARDAEIAAVVRRLPAILQQIQDDPRADVNPLARPLRTDRRRFEQRLAAVVHTPNAPCRLAAARLLTCIATRRSYRLLIELSRWSPVRAEAIRALARLSRPAELVQWIRAEPDPTLRQELLAALLQRGSPAAVTSFLRLVERPEYAAQTLASLDRVDHPPIDALLALLDRSSRVATRIAAARVLGRLDDPAVTRRLVRRALADSTSREALVALVESREPLATAFLARVRREIRLAPLVRAAQARAASLPN